MNVIRRFTGRYNFLSNFYVHDVWYGGVAYYTNEHAYQAQKTLNPEQRLWIQQASTAAEAKRRGQQVTLRADWEKIKDGVMIGVVAAKFSDPELRKMLIDTYDAFIEEGNLWCDTWFGVCYCKNHQGGIGENRLGKALMAIRYFYSNQDRMF